MSEEISFLVYNIYNFATQDKDGDFFWKSPSLYNRVYLGISHGSCLIISFLTSIYEMGIEKELCAKILEKAINFIKKHYRKSKYRGLFPNMIGDKIEPMQFSLCYGDIGVGYALYRYSKVFSNSEIQSFASIILDDCLLRTKEDNLTLDASIYYGAAGLAIAFEKLGYISKDSRFSKRADYWNEQILSYSLHSNNYAGFKSRLVEEGVIWEISFGWGIVGIGLTLMYFDKESLPPLADLTFIA
jgi:hypothetical protein